MAYICAAHYGAAECRVLEVPWHSTEIELTAELSGAFAARFTNLRVLHVVRGALNLEGRAVADRALLAALEESTLAGRHLGIIICVGERGYDRFAAAEMLKYADAVVGFDGAREDDSEAGVALTFSSALHSELAKEGRGDLERRYARDAVETSLATRAMLAVETARITLRSVCEFRGLYSGQTAAFEIKYALVSPHDPCVDAATGRVHISSMAPSEAMLPANAVPGALAVGVPFALLNQMLSG